MEQGFLISSYGVRSVLQIWLDCSVEGQKKWETVTEALKTIFEEDRKPQYIWTEKGNEYCNKDFKELLQKHDITL